MRKKKYEKILSHQLKKTEKIIIFLLFLFDHRVFCSFMPNNFVYFFLFFIIIFNLNSRNSLFLPSFAPISLKLLYYSFHVTCRVTKKKIPENIILFPLHIITDTQIFFSIFFGPDCLYAFLLLLLHFFFLWRGKKMS